MKQGTIFNVDENLTKEEILDAIESDIAIIDAICMKPESFNENRYKSQCVKLIFSKTVLPNKVHLAKCRLSLKFYSVINAADSTLKAMFKNMFS